MVNLTSRLGVRSKSELLVVFIALLLMTFAGTSVLREALNDLYPFEAHAGFLLAVFIVQWMLLSVLVLPVLIALPARVVLVPLALVTAASAYFSRQYGVIIDTTMIQNVMETDLREATDLLSFTLVLSMSAAVLTPIVVLNFLAVDRPPIMKRLVIYPIAMLVCLLVTAGALALHSAQFASFFREHKTVRMYSNPIFPIYSIARYGYESAVVQDGGVLQVSEPESSIPDHEGRELIILVVGETARADHFSLNGYERETNPRLSSIAGVTSYSDVISCGTSTAVSVPCMFSFATADEFDRSSILREENVLDVLARIGVSVLWRDNNSGSKGVADRVRFEDFSRPENNPVCDIECRDVGMLHGLQDYIDEQPGDILIVLHQMGNHGPLYRDRYPREESYFQPECESAELSACSREEIVNAYDNAIRYTDFFLAEVIGLLQRNQDFEATMLYLSDHGESLGERGIYLHGLPNMIAPNEQRHVPMLVWTSENSGIAQEDLVAIKDQRFSHDALSYSLLHAFEARDFTMPLSNSYFSVATVADSQNAATE